MEYLEYYIHLAILSEIYLLLSLGLLMVMGWGGLFNLAQIALYGLGAYTTALLATDYGFSTVPCFLLSILFTCLLALVIGAISLRLKQDYFAIGSLAFAFVINTLLMNWKSLTHGVLGIPGIPRPQLGTLTFEDNSSFLVMSSIFCAVFLLLSICISRSPLKRALIAQAEFEEGAAAIGIHPPQVRIGVFVISACYAGIAGAHFAYYLNFIDPTSFSLSEMIFLVSIVVLGGMKNVLPLCGATLFLVLLPEALRFVELPDSVLGPLRQFIYATILFLVIFVRKRSLFPPMRSI